MHLTLRVRISDGVSGQVQAVRRAPCARPTGTRPTFGAFRNQALVARCRPVEHQIMTDPARAAVTASQHVDAPPETVWHALTDGDTLARWWAPGDVQPVVGHAFTLDMGG